MNIVLRRDQSADPCVGSVDVTVDGEEFLAAPGARNDCWTVPDGEVRVGFDDDDHAFFGRLGRPRAIPSG